MEFSGQFLALVPVIVGLVQAIKKTGYVKSRFLPLLAIALGIVGAWLLTGFSSLDVIQGIIAGLSASGLWSGSKATFEKEATGKKKK